MPRYAVLVLLLAAGCTDARKRATAVPIESKAAEATPEVAVPRPAQTDPAAESLIAKLLNAHTDGLPERLEKLRNHTHLRTGKVFEAEANGMISGNMNAMATWPDRYRVSFRKTTLGDKQYIITLRGETGWLVDERVSQVPGPMSPLYLPVVTADVRAEWMLTLVPLLDPKGRIAALETTSPVDGKPTRGLRVWLGERDPILLVLDEGSSQLREVHYTSVEGGKTLAWRLAVPATKVVNGVVLPAKLQVLMSDTIRYDWSKCDYEFPATIAPEKFEKP